MTCSRWQRTCSMHVVLQKAARSTGLLPAFALEVQLSRLVCAKVCHPQASSTAKCHTPTGLRFLKALR